MTMKRTLIVAAAAIALLQAPAHAQKAEALAKQSTCMNCHAVDTKKVGPSFKEVSAKNKGAGADKVVASLKAKPVHAAAAKATKDADLKTIVTWILSQ
jgi:cytochrome c